VPRKKDYSIAADCALYVMAGVPKNAAKPALSPCFDCPKTLTEQALPLIGVLLPRGTRVFDPRGAQGASPILGMI
jgi:hypothetical protein